MNTPEELVTCVVAGVLERGGLLGKTKLVKLLYLIDVELYARYRQTATGFTWVYYFFGPYDARIEPVLRRIDFDVPQEEVMTASGMRAVTFRPSNISDLLERVRLDDRIRRAADRVLDRWALDDLNTILDHVYFHTEPMINARPGETLDFRTIPRYAMARPTPQLPPIDPETLSTLRERLRAARTEHRRLQQLADEQRRRLFREPDATYAALLRAVGEIEEREARVEGAVLVSPSWADEE